MIKIASLNLFYKYLTENMIYDLVSIAIDSGKQIDNITSESTTQGKVNFTMLFFSLLIFGLKMALLLWLIRKFSKKNS